MAGIVRRSLGLPTTPLPFAKRVAVGQTTVSSPEVIKPLATLNAGKPYAQQIKPFNFILSCHVAPFGHPIGADPERFHLIAPYETRPAEVGDACRGSSSTRRSATGSARRRRAPRGPLRASRATATCSKSTSSIPRPSAPMPAASRAAGKASGCWAGATSGSRRSTYIGKESNKLEEVEEQGSPDAADVYTEYPESAARRVGDEDPPEAQGHAIAGAHAADRTAAVDASGDSGGKEAASKESSHSDKCPRKGGSGTALAAISRE